MDKGNLVKIFKVLRKENHAPVTELKYKTKFQLLISVILSAQATDKSVNAATTKLFKVAVTPKKIYALGEEKLKSFIKSIGLYNAKAKNVIQTCKILMTKYHGRVPSDRETLQKLPGVGRKTANVVLNNAFGLPTICVDTHVFRVSNRLGIAPGKNVIEVENKPIALFKYEDQFYALKNGCLHQGFPLAELIKIADPQSSVKFIQFVNSFTY